MRLGPPRDASEGTGAPLKFCICFVWRRGADIGVAGWVGGRCRHRIAKGDRRCTLPRNHETRTFCVRLWRWSPTSMRGMPAVGPPYTTVCKSRGSPLRGVRACTDREWDGALAASVGWLDGLDLLLASGCDPLLNNRAGETALHIAYQHRHPEAVSLLSAAAQGRVSGAIVNRDVQSVRARPFPLLAVRYLFCR